MFEELKKWYAGTYKAYENEPYSAAFIVGLDHQLHWTARVARTLVGFWLAHWQWIIGTTIALAGLALAYRRLG